MYYEYDLVGRKCVAKLMNLKNEVDKELKTTHPHFFIAINTKIEKRLAILGGAMKDLLCDWRKSLLI